MARRKAKTSQNTVILVAVVTAALVFAAFGSQASDTLAIANLVVIVLGTGLALGLLWLIYYQVSLRARRDEAVTAEGLDRLNWKQFEFAVISLLKQQGYHIDRHSSNPGDSGADIIASKGRHKYAIQVKHYHRNLDNTPVQEAVAAKAFYKCDCSMVVTNSHFTAGAKLLAAANDCVLVDREVLGEWILASPKKYSHPKTKRVFSHR